MCHPYIESATALSDTDTKPITIREYGSTLYVGLASANSG